jgi:predicted alpha/beta superfamily hydrolase
MSTQKINHMKTQIARIVNRYALLLAAVVLSLASCSEEEEFNPEFVREFTLPSNLDGALYTITVGLPSGYNPSVERYSTIYVLDGEEDFDFVANRCKEISAQHGVKNVLVVGIGYGNDRSIDYTPTKVSSVTGGGPAFLAFIEGQLIPRIEQEFGADTTRASRVILGHSYGGLFGTFAFIEKNILFGNYILLSPSLWFDNEVTLEMEQQSRIENISKHHLVFLGIGELENSGRMQAPFEAFYQVLGDNYPSISLSKNREDDLDHMGSKNPNIIKGLNYYFENR